MQQQHESRRACDLSYQAVRDFLFEVLGNVRVDSYSHAEHGIAASRSNEIRERLTEAGARFNPISETSDLRGVLANCNDEDASQYINRKESVPDIIARLAERGVTHGYHATNALIYAVTAGFKVNASAFRDVFRCTNDFYMVSGAAVTKKNDDTSFHDYVDTVGEKGEAFGDVLRKHGIELSEHEQQLKKLAVILKVDLSGYLRFKQAAEVPFFTESDQGDLLCALCPPPPRFVRPWIVVE